MKKIFKVLENSDLTEGRGPMRVIGIFTNEVDAQKVWNRYSRGVMGFKGKSSDEIEEDILFESFEEYDKWKGGEVKRRALSKLTREEKKALGLKD